MAAATRTRRVQSGNTPANSGKKRSSAANTTTGATATPASRKRKRTDADKAELETPTPTRNARTRSGHKHVKFGDMGSEVETNSVKAEVKHESPSAKPAAKSKNVSKSKKSPKPKRELNDADLEAGASLAKSMSMLPADAEPKTSPKSPNSKSKANNYGLTHGVSPYPTFPHPTPEECARVRKLLASVHGDKEAPKTIPTPSLQSSGCGEVPSVLDALVRTRLSAATNNANSSRAFRGLVEKFGLIKSGIGQGSVDWEKVRTRPQKEVFEAIKTGGLADVKSRDIQAILNLVKEENEVERKKGSDLAPPVGVLSLDHLHGLGTEDAFHHLLRYPGIGPKTASCVLLFCMQRPSFAVDTHVFRLTRWMGWTPSDAQVRALNKRGESKSGGAVTRESTYAHLDVRIPDDLKYPLHYLLIRHGKDCGWCSAKAGRDAKVAGSCILRKEGVIGSGGSSKKKIKNEVKEEDVESDDEVKFDDDEEED